MSSSVLAAGKDTDTAGLIWVLKVTWLHFYLTDIFSRDYSRLSWIPKNLSKKLWDCG